MTPDELITEFNYRFDERIAILCGTNEPTVAQRKMAISEADEAVRKLKQHENH